ncbi:solute carrier family 2, facilitated glucose transporter member 11 isoform X2 [Hemicordylus capensis]|uniref:solute carrier family 2, facilitated glucose transporter member 11 isoform X2 n=1 Tax=Hemicordylus capensis TaxID=884348 RepID=UPI0023033C00|nr:solute carrier family 2, facilitated glucose transporter member 11 isoform X2 [Hemicordylus capensis]
MPPPLRAEETEQLPPAPLLSPGRHLPQPEPARARGPMSAPPSTPAAAQLHLGGQQAAAAAAARRGALMRAQPGKQPQPQPRASSPVLILTVCAAGVGGTFQYGYNLTVINAPTPYIQTFMNKTWLERTGRPLEGRAAALIWSFIVSVFSLGGLAGALLAGPMAIKLGRKKSLLLNNLFVVLAAFLVGFSRMAGSFEMIMLSRFLAGINAGVGMNVQPMYLGESAPKEFRGAVALTSASFTALGLVLGQTVGLRELLGAEENWPLLLASNVVPGLIQLVLLPWAPESPRYLLIDRGDEASCISALRRLRGSDDLSAEMKEMLAEQAATQGEAAKAPWDLFRNRAVRWQLITIVVLSSAMQLCGNDSMYFYATYIFQEAGIPSDQIPYIIIGTGSCELITSVTCNLLIERAGRRVLVIGGYSLMAIWAVVFMVALALQDRFLWMPYLSMACLFAYILSFGIGPAGVTGVIPTELFDQLTRPAAYMICGSLLWSNLFVVGMAFPFIVEGLGYFCYLPFLTVCVCTALYVGFFLPETQGKTFLEISEEFNKRNFPAKARENSWTDLEETKSTML